MQILVLGMHRAGTSAVARLLNMMGAYFAPEELALPPTEANATGYWERRDVMRLNNDILSALGFRWDRVAQFEPTQITPDVQRVFQARAAAIVLGLDAHRPWMMKDPRFSLLLPFWLPLLSVPVCVYVYRHPLEIAKSLQRREGFSLAFGLALWEKYTVCGLENSQQLPRLFVSYHHLLHDPVATVHTLYTELEKQGVQGLRLPTEREITGYIDPALAHEKAEDPDPSLSRESAALYQILANPPVSATIPPLSSSAAEILQAHETRQQVVGQLKIAVVHFGENLFLELKRDIVLGIYHTIRALGFDVVISNNVLDPNRLNVIIGLDLMSPEVRTRLRTSKLAYVIYETEIIHNGTLNSRPQAAIDLESDYLPALAQAWLVISPFKYVAEVLQRYGIKAAYAPWGYIPEFDNEIEPRINKGIDCYFFGIITPKRRQVLTALTQAGLKVKTSDYPGVPTFLRNHFMSRAKLVLSLQHDKEWMTVNPYRILYAVQNHCCMVVEKQPHDMDGYSDYGTPVETGDLVEYCIELIHSRHYQTLQTKKRAGVVANPMKPTFEKIFLQ